MSRLTVEIPDKVIEEEKLKELKALRSKVKRQDIVIKDLRKRLAEGQDAIDKANNLRTLVRDNYGFYDEW
jgi:uncharacterized coiled-coil protein SlyX